MLSLKIWGQLKMAHSSRKIDMIRFIKFTVWVFFSQKICHHLILLIQNVCYTLEFFAAIFSDEFLIGRIASIFFWILGGLGQYPRGKCCPFFCRVWGCPTQHFNFFVSQTGGNALLFMNFGGAIRLLKRSVTF